MDYKKVHKFYMSNGRKKNRGLLPFHTERIMQELAKTEGYKITLFRPTYNGDIRKWVSGSHDYSRDYRYYSPKFVPDNKEQLCIIDKNITPNNQSDYLPIDNYILGVRGHVIGVKDGIVNDETNPNGSKNNIAGIINEQGNILGMMPHPERATDKVAGLIDGEKFFISVLESIQ